MSGRRTSNGRQCRADVRVESFSLRSSAKSRRRDVMAMLGDQAIRRNTGTPSRQRLEFADVMRTEDAHVVAIALQLAKPVLVPDARVVVLVHHQLIHGET